MIPQWFSHPPQHLTHDHGTTVLLSFFSGHCTLLHMILSHCATPLRASNIAVSFSQTTTSLRLPITHLTASCPVPPCSNHCDHFPLLNIHDNCIWVQSYYQFSLVHILILLVLHLYVSLLSRILSVCLVPHITIIQPHLCYFCPPPLHCIYQSPCCYLRS